ASIFDSSSGFIASSIDSTSTVSVGFNEIISSVTFGVSSIVSITSVVSIISGCSTISSALSPSIVNVSSDELYIFIFTECYNKVLIAVLHS
ncbi:hypothetical protein DERP_012418, partial [Dermatophagoides pteronyssinus]